MNKDIQISINHKADIAIINIIGDVTATTKEEIYDAYKSDNLLNSQKILLSFDENCYINGGGIEALIDIAVKGYKKRQKINACGLSNHFQKIFCMVGLANGIQLIPPLTLKNTSPKVVDPPNETVQKEKFTPVLLMVETSFTMATKLFSS